MTPNRRFNQDEDHVPPFPDDESGRRGRRGQVTQSRRSDVSANSRERPSGAIPSAPLRLATGDIRRVERLLMNSETTARLLARITRPAVRT